LVDGRHPLAHLFRIGAKKDVLTHLHQNPSFRLVSWGDEIDGHKRDRRGHKREPKDQRPLAPQRMTQRSEIDVASRDGAWLPIRLYARLHEHSHQSAHGATRNSILNDYG